MKTNHRRGFKNKRHAGAVFSRYSKYVKVVAMDGVVVAAVSTTGDHCRGKRGIRRDAAGAKRFIHSRARRRQREAIKKLMADGY